MAHVHIAVIGGGITGRLVQHLIPEATIYDWMPHPRAIMPLTRNYGANYLWQPLPHIECRSFPVITHVDGRAPTLHNVRDYKAKIGKSGDVVGWERQFQLYSMGYDFKELPPSTILYDHRITSIDRQHQTLRFAKQGDITYDLLISTIPLYSLLSLAGVDEPPGRLMWKPIYFKVTRRPPDAPFPLDTLYVNYLSNPNIGPYRFTDRFGERHYESIVPFDGPATKRFSPGKIYPNAHVAETLEVLEGYGIYTFGRYGSWNPDELVHETYDHIVQWRDRVLSVPLDDNSERIHNGVD